MLLKRFVLGFRHFVTGPRELSVKITDARMDKSPGGRKTNPPQNEIDRKESSA